VILFCAVTGVDRVAAVGILAACDIVDGCSRYAISFDAKCHETFHLRQEMKERDHDEERRDERTGGYTIKQPRRLGGPPR
jgi:hypothetical protein